MVRRCFRYRAAVILATLLIQCMVTGAGAARLATYTSRHGRPPPTGLFVEPEDGVTPLVRLLNAAQRTIFVETYILTDSRIVRAIERAAAQGVAVDVVLEPHPLGMGTQPERMREALLAAGVAVRWSAPRYTFTHAKFIVIDDSIGIVSTANFSRSGFFANREFLDVVTDRRDVVALDNVFRADWDGITPGFDDPSLVVAPLHARRTVEGLIGGSRRALDIDAEELLDVRVERLLIEAAKRGVRVRVLVPAISAATSLQSLRAAGIAVRALPRPYMHAKAMVVDRRIAFLGSENLSATSLDRNREVGIILGPRAAQRVERVFARDWRRAST